GGPPRVAGPGPEGSGPLPGHGGRPARRGRAGTPGRVLGAAATLELTARIRDHVDGLGVLQELVAPGVTDLLVNDDGTVWVDDADGLRRTAHRLGPAQARDLAVRLATVGGRRLDDAMPWADAHLPSGIRFHAVLPPLSPGGAILSLRLPAERRLGLEDLERL